MRITYKFLSVKNKSVLKLMTKKFSRTLSETKCGVPTCDQTKYKCRNINKEITFYRYKRKSFVVDLFKTKKKMFFSYYF